MFTTHLWQVRYWACLTFGDRSMSAEKSYVPGIGVDGKTEDG